MLYQPHYTERATLYPSHAVRTARVPFAFRRFWTCRRSMICARTVIHTPNVRLNINFNLELMFGVLITRRI